MLGSFVLWCTAGKEIVHIKFLSCFTQVVLCRLLSLFASEMFNTGMPALLSIFFFSTYSIVQMLLLAHCLFRADHILFKLCSSMSLLHLDHNLVLSLYLIGDNAVHVVSCSCPGCDLHIALLCDDGTQF